VSRPTHDRLREERPVRVAIDRVVIPGPGEHDAAELRAGLARSLGPALAVRLGPEAVERIVSALSVSVAQGGPQREGGPTVASREGEGRDGA